MRVQLKLDAKDGKDRRLKDKLIRRPHAREPSTLPKCLQVRSLLRALLL
jgi:hypothetical protein